MRKVLFLDRDGIINVEKNYLYRIEDFEFITDTIDLMKEAVLKGYDIIVVSNQAGIAKGKYTVEDYFVLNCWMVNQLKKMGIDLLDTFYSPYHQDGTVVPYNRDDESRKPRPGMFLEAHKKYDIDFSQSIMVGDRFSDVLAGYNANVGSLYLVEASYNYRDFRSDDYPDVRYKLIQTTKQVQL